MGSNASRQLSWLVSTRRPVSFSSFKPTRTMATTSSDSKAATHFNDWPNAIGLDAHYEERTPVELRVEGSIPSYVNGTLFRTGLGPRQITTEKGDTFKINHWFDNFSQVHRFQISPGKIIYNSRLTSDGLLEQARKTGQLKGITFGKKYEPCKSFFKKAQTVFSESPRAKAPNERNVGVTMTANYPGLNKNGKATSTPYKGPEVAQITMSTDASSHQTLDPETLEPIGVAEQSTLHPDLKGPLSAAHAEHDPFTGDIFNHNLDLGRNGTYRIFRTSAATAKTSILATFTHTPAYVHSQFITENFFIICVWNSSFTMGGASILWNRNLLEAMAWNPKPATWFVVDKRPPEEGGKGLIAKYESDPFFSFHSINAYEETVDGKTDIVADLTAYEDMSILDRFYFENMLSDSPDAARWSDPKNGTSNKARSTYRRYRLPAVPAVPTKSVGKATLEHQSDHNSAPELPTINPRFSTKKHQFVYGISDTGLSTIADSLVKYDVAADEVKRWRIHGHTPGEAIFIPDPNSTEEDGGVLVTVVLDGIEGKSYMLILDAKTLDTVAKAHVDGVVGLAFHGLWAGAASASPSAVGVGGGGGESKL